MLLSVFDKLALVGTLLQRIQSVLSFRDWEGHSQFKSTHGLGRVGLTACLLGVFLGSHLVLATILALHIHDFVSLTVLLDICGQHRLQLLWQWTVYVSLLCSFHLLEFFTTAVYNADVTSADSFLVNHSTTYTFAAIFTWTEFAVRLLFFPRFNNATLSCTGLVVVLVSQCIRSSAMITCGESFNHLIQKSRKDNHVLIKHGIYRYLRHPSYVGFYYWSMGTQMVLNNPIAGILSAVASSIFFRRRIPYEEESLVCHFGEEYVEYAKRTWIGIPFVPTRTVTSIEGMTEGSSANDGQNSSSNSSANKDD